MAELPAQEAMMDTVIPLRPDARAPAPRGWHGMTPRALAKYTQSDYASWIAADLDGNARVVDVAPWSPAAKAGIMTGDWVVLVDGERLDMWELHGASVDARVRIMLYRHPTGRWAVDVILIQRPPRLPRQRQVCAASGPYHAPGCHLGAKQRLQWQAAMFNDRYLSALAREVATYLATVRANKANMAFPSRATIASDLGVSIRTIDRAVARLRGRGWIKVISGRGTGESNRYWLTWPAGS
jgi:hypothetical protein